MKKISKVWWAILAVAFCTIVITFRFSNVLIPAMNQALSVTERDAHDFLPISIKDGTIVSPQNKVVQKSYQIEDEVIHVVMDTTTDELNLSTHPGQGFYITRKCLYGIARNEVKSSCFDATANADLTEEQLKEFLPVFRNYALALIYAYIFVLALIWCFLAILVYTVLMHWIMALAFKTKFKQTWFINTLVYATLAIIPYDFGFLITYVIMTGINLFCAKKMSKTE